jgi:hypothetical protein
MPLKLFSDLSSSQEIAILNNVSFHDIAGEKYFIITDSIQSNEIRVNYIPNFLTNRDPDRYECFLFENTYLTAENDVYELYENTLDGRIGWIFPVTSLDSNENDFAENGSFKHYRHIAYEKLLVADYQIQYQEGKS